MPAVPSDGLPDALLDGRHRVISEQVPGPGDIGHEPDDLPDTIRLDENATAASHLVNYRPGEAMLNV
jgi:hypothetical protein